VLQKGLETLLSQHPGDQAAERDLVLDDENPRAALGGGGTGLSVQPPLAPDKSTNVVPIYRC
jgi:hypothetical protein